ncbi:MAG: ABC transporter ATP-binding protein/permease [Firmicutes bacterium]|nr:ABC transporter ATP-binding protein/permease [Bacillota bacterium]
MLSIFKRILELSKDRAPRIKLSYLFSFLARIFTALPVAGILFILFKIITPEKFGELKIIDLWFTLSIVIVGLILQYIFHSLVFKFASLSGFETVADERISMGNHLKRLPMGAFSEKNVGEMSAVVTTDLTFIENHSFKMLDVVLNGFLSIIVAFLFMLVIDWRLAIILALVTVFAVIFLNKNQALGKNLGKRRQETQGKLIQASLEYIQGMSVIKAYNMTGEKAKRLHDTIDTACENALDLEKQILPSISKYGYVFDIGVSLLIFFGAVFALQASLGIASLFMLFIYVFMMFLPARAVVVAATVIRILDASLDRYEAIKDLEQLREEEDVKTIDSYDIAFENVSFAYEKNNVIKNASFTIPEKSMTALVGQSGSGKTTITKLIARFWDVQSGSIKIGGVDVKDMSVDHLLKNISMVFQKVYLFNDTILNNIKFGKPDATEDEVIAAAKKARCHEFILNLKDGYNTIIGEGGDTLSGGEKQRISIARAILKNAPIVLLDEATASLDPQNEKFIQEAITELIKNKTLVVIAHRLSTIKSADKILVLDNGALMEHGTHQELLDKNGLYNRFWERRTKAHGWRIVS